MLILMPTFLRSYQNGTFGIFIFLLASASFNLKYIYSEGNPHSKGTIIMAHNLEIYACTFNCAKSFPFNNESHIKVLLEQLIPQVSFHDFYILGFQELVLIWQGSFPQIVLKRLEDLEKKILQRLNSGSKKYKCVNINCLGAIGIMMFCKAEYDILNVRQCNIRCGTFYSSLKGASAIKVTISINGIVETIVGISVHLAANEGERNLLRRLQDYETIRRNMTTEFGSILNSHVFFVGDMNFRLTKRFSDVNYADPNTIEYLIERNDELTAAIRENSNFELFSEPKISFPPTFKYIVHEQNLPTDPLAYNLKRQPSWCDRILYKGYTQPVKIHLYKPIPRTSDFYFTDHQPVVLSLTVPRIQPDMHTSASFPTSQMSFDSLRHTFGYLTDIILGYSGWLYFEHPIITSMFLLVLIIYGMRF